MPIDNSVVEKDSAEIWRRIAALVYDGFILLALSMAFGTLALAVSSLLGNKPDDSYTPVVNENLTFALWYFVLAYFYYYFWRKGGQTVGMKAWRLKLLGWDGNIASKQSCIIRAVVAPVVIQVFFIGYFWKLFDKEKLCLQDRLSKTKVIVLQKQK